MIRLLILIIRIDLKVTRQHGQFKIDIISPDRSMDRQFITLQSDLSHYTAKQQSNRTIKPMLIRSAVLFLCVLALYQTSQLSSEPQHKHIVYHMIHSYADYHRNFTSVAGLNNTIEMTEFGTGTEICAREVCRFYVYLHEPPKQDIKSTILFTSGMHGNELLGPTTLLYAFSLLKPKYTRIIYMPVCNPSGYERKTRETYPNLVDVNRDFPIDGNRNCYLSTSTRILDKLFRTYKIDLTVNLHNGGDEIAWNWGTRMHQSSPKTEDYDIYSSVGLMMRYYGGFNKRLGIKEFKTGTMDEIVYPAEGTLDDWAYAGSWADSKISKCQKYDVQDYPKNMHQGLVFLLQLGEHNVAQNMLGTSEGLNESSTSDKIYNGYITRALRMLVQLTKFVEPVISAIRDNHRLMVKIEGCSTIQQLSLTLTCDKHQNSPLTLSPQFSEYKQHSFSHLISATIPKTLIDLEAGQTVLSLEYQIQCDKGWQNKGKSPFSKPRIYEGIINITNIMKAEEKSQFITINGHKVIPAGEQFYSIIKLAVVPVLLFFLFIYCFCCRKKAMELILNFMKRNKNTIKSNQRKRSNINEHSENSFGTNLQMVQESPDDKVGNQMLGQIDVIHEQQI